MYFELDTGAATHVPIFLFNTFEPVGGAFVCTSDDALRTAQPGPTQYNQMQPYDLMS